MKTAKFTEEQIAFTLRQTEPGTPAKEVSRETGITTQTFCQWKKKHIGLGTSELRRLRQLEEGNRRLKQMVVDLSLDKNMSKRCSQKSSEACTQKGDGTVLH